MMQDDRDICGFGILSLPPDHPFTPACRRHDYWFTQKSLGNPTPGRKRVDEQLLKEMLYIAKMHGSTKLKIMAYVYYGIAKAVGKIFWET